MRGMMAMMMLGAMAAGCGATSQGAEGEPRNNQPPVADAGSDQLGVSTTQEVPLDGSSSFDPEDRDMTFSWAIESAPAGSNAPLLNAGTEHAVLVPDVEGTYYLRLTVSDGFLDSDPDLVQVVVDNSAPEAVAGDDRQSRTNCGGVELNAMESTDPNGDYLQYQWTLTQKPAGSTAVIADPSAAQTYFIPDRSGLYSVELVVSDGKISSPSDSFDVDVDGDVLRNGNVLVVNNVAPYDILEFSPNGGYLGKFLDGSTVGVSAWRNLYGITEQANGTILVSAAVSQRVFKISASGAFQGEWSTAYSQGNLSVPQGLLETPTGKILVATWRTLGVGRHAVQEFSSGGGFTGDFKQNPSLNSPRNIILACNGEYLITNSENDSIDRYHGTTYDYLGALVTGVNSPTGIAQTQDGTLLVTRFQNSNVEKFRPNGLYDGGFTGAGSGLSAPSGVVQLGNGNVVVTSTGNDRVKLFNETGGLIGDLGTGAPLTDPIGVIQLRN